MHTVDLYRRVRLVCRDGMSEGSTRFCGVNWQDRPSIRMASRRSGAALAPFGEPAHGREVGETGVPVPDVGGEGLPEAPLGALRGREERRRRCVARGRGRARGAVSRYEVGEHGRGVHADSSRAEISGWLDPGLTGESAPAAGSL